MVLEPESNSEEGKQKEEDFTLKDLSPRELFEAGKDAARQGKKRGRKPKAKNDKTDMALDTQTGRRKAGIPIYNPQPIIEYISKHHTTQIQVADEIGVNRAHFNRAIHGQPTSFTLITKIAEHLGVTWWRLIIPPEYEIIPKQDADFLRLWREMQRRPPDQETPKEQPND